MGPWVGLPVLLLAVALQTTLVPQIRLWDGGPDLVFLCVLAWALRAPLAEGVAWAFTGGIMQDLLSLAPTGQSVIGLVLLVFVVNVLTEQFSRTGLLTLLLLAGAGTLAQQLLMWSLFAFQGYTVDFLDDLGYVIFPTVIYNFALILPVFAVLRFVQRRVEARQLVAR
ncbi:MAG: rod shape-determining protein MreD [Anaerolineaceae bacterium]|nr:rod shape-determining protein MreD [Anaerolineaceae bacterium]